MAAASMALTAVSGIVDAGSSVYAGNAAGAAADYNAQMARNNAQEARNQAAEEERRSRVQSRQVIGSQRAAAGASGVQLEGSALDSIEESAANGELDALTIRHGGQAKAANYESEAQLENYKGKQARIGGYVGGASALLKSGSKIAGSGMGG